MAQRKAKPYEVGELDHYLFGQGNHYEIYKKLGAHKVKKGKKEGVYFAVWAPHARSVSVVGDFNGWNEQANRLMEYGSESDGERRASWYIYVFYSRC